RSRTSWPPRCWRSRRCWSPPQTARRCSRSRSRCRTPPAPAIAWSPTWAAIRLPTDLAPGGPGPGDREAQQAGALGLERLGVLAGDGVVRLDAQGGGVTGAGDRPDPVPATVDEDGPGPAAVPGR